MKMDQEVMREVASVMVDLTALLVQAVEAEDSEAAYTALQGLARPASDEGVAQAILGAVHGYDIKAAVLSTLATMARLIKDDDPDDTFAKVVAAGRRIGDIAEIAAVRMDEAL